MEKPPRIEEPENLDEILRITQNFVNKNHLQRAIGYLKEQVEKFPFSYKLCFETAHLCKSLGRPDDAIFYTHKAVELDPDNDSDLNNLGTYYETNAEFERALTYYKKAVKVNPDNIIAFCNMANLYEKFNELDNALDTLENIPDKNKRDPYPQIIKARLLRRQKQFDQAADALYKIDDDDIEDNAQKVFKYYELVKIEDKRGNFDKAFEHIKTASDFWFKQPEIRFFKKEKPIQDIIKTGQIFNPIWVSSWSPTPQPKRSAPVQVIGFPRSGTTLIDQILQAHPAIAGMEEESSAEDTFKKMKKMVGPFFRNISSFSENQIIELQNFYFDEAHKYCKFNDDQIILDKNPFNMPNIGPLLRIFKDMKTIIMLRHPYDCVLSSLMQIFAPNKGTIYLSDLKQAAEYYNVYFSVIEEFQKAFPTAPFYEIRYEDLISNQKEESKYLLEFLNLPWDESVLRFYENEDKALVTSASYAQVNQPLYESSLYRWKNYEKHFEPVKDILQPWVEKFGYEA